MPKLDWKKLVKKNELFRSLSDVELEQLIDPDTSAEKSYPAGGEIIRHGERGRNFYLIGAGSVGISTPGPEGCDIELAILETGEFFGEMSLLRQQPRTATVRAREDCIVLKVSAEKLRRLLNQRPEIMAGIFILLSERMRNLAERVINVSYHEVNHKLELFSTKLDAELKAMNSTLAATQAVFDQTTTRANEVITSTERNWTRMTVIGSVATTVLSVMIAGFGWLGISSYQDFKKTIGQSSENVEKMTAGFESKLEDIATQTEIRAAAVKDSLEQVESLSSQAKELVVNVEKQQAALQSGASYSVVPILEKLGRTNAKASRHYIPILQSNLKLVLSANQHESATVAFTELYSWIVQSMLSTTDEAGLRIRQRQIAFVLGSIVDAGDKIPNRNRVLAYYFLLANLAMERNNTDYELRRDELNELLRKTGSGALLEDDKQNFEPLAFDLAIESMNMPPVEENAMRQKISVVWQKVAGS